MTKQKTPAPQEPTPPVEPLTEAKTETPDPETPEVESAQPAPTPPETKPLSPLLQRLALHFADTKDDLTAEGVADRLACQWLDELEQQLARYTDTDGRLTQLLSNQPQLVTLLEAMLADQLPLRVAVRRTLTAEDLDPQPGDDDYETFARQKADDEQQLADLDTNLKQSMEVLQKFAQENELDEQAQHELVDAINADFDNLLSRRITAGMLLGYRKRLRYDADVADARSKGELEGRNANIAARMAADKAAQVGDGLPLPQHGGYAPKMLQGQRPVIDFSKY